MKRIVPFLLGFVLLPSISNAQTSGNGLEYDGVDDYIDCPLPSIFNSIGTSEFTIELWASPTLGSFQRLFFAQKDASNFAVITIITTGEVVFYLEENGINHSVQSSSVLNSLEWHHIAVTWKSSTSEAKIFVNGNETPYAAGSYISSTGLDNKMTIGSRTDGSQPYLGEIDEIAIWSIAKSECEVSFEMKDKKEGTEPNLEAYYNFDYGIPEGSNPGVDDLQDISPSGYDGTLLNFALSGSTSNWISSLATITRLWGEQSPLFLGQLGLVPSVDANNYQWINCNTGAPIAGATNVTFDPPSEDPNYAGATGGIYAVISTQANCIDTSECYVFATGSMNNLSAHKFNIYPNPSNGVVSIESSLEIDRIDVVSITGEVLKTIHPNSTGISDFELANQNGLYLIVLHSSAGLITKKILVQN